MGFEVSDLRPRWERLREGVVRGFDRVPRSVRISVCGVAALICAGGLTGFLLNRPVSSVPRTREVLIGRGLSVQQIGELLEREGLVRSAVFFAVAAAFSPGRQRIQAGVHEVDGGARTTAILRSLGQARDVSLNVTVPEGLTLREVGSLLGREAGLDGGRFVSVCTDPAFCRELGVGSGSLEGYLFPETYRLPARPDEGRVARLMLAQFRKVFDGAMRARAESLRMSIHQVVTLASIVEREARLPQERAVISGVFHRRLKVGMRLESDPTTEYALGVRKQHLYNADLSVDSPYNTYRYPGLPPGPIANPGRASLEAALYPSDQGYLFFVARGDGSHVFSRTKGEHDRVRAEIRKEQRKPLSDKGTRGSVAIRKESG